MCGIPLPGTDSRSVTSGLSNIQVLDRITDRESP